LLKNSGPQVQGDPTTQRYIPAERSPRSLERL